MQQVYDDGRLGEKIDIDLKDKESAIEKMLEAIQQPDVDHLRLYEQGKGTVGISEINEKDIEQKLEKIVDIKIKEEFDRRKILKEFNELKIIANPRVSIQD